MPSLSFFVDEHDLCFLLDRLNADPEIAFIVPDDPLGPESEKPDQTPRHSPRFVLTFHFLPKFISSS